MLELPVVFEYSALAPPAVLLLPVVLSLVLTLMGAVLRPHADQVSAAALNAGALMALLLLAVIGAAGAVSLRALRAAEGQS